MDKKLVLSGIGTYSEQEDKNFQQQIENGENVLRSVCISTTNSCNLRCNYCFAEGEEIPKSNPLTLEQQISIIDQALELGAKSLVICGNGEPTIDKNLIPIIEHANGNNLTSILFTNGIVFGDDRLAKNVHGKSGNDIVKLLSESDVSIILKLETLKKSLYNEIVGRDAFQFWEKAFERMKNVGFCKKSKFNNMTDQTRLAIATVVMRDNLSEVPSLRDFAHQNNTQYICKLPSIRGGVEQNSDNFFDPSTAKTANIKSNLRQFTDQQETLISPNNTGCLAWSYGIVLGNDGFVRKCYTSPYDPLDTIGNVKDTPLSELLQKRRQMFPPQKNTSCPVKQEMYTIRDLRS